MRLIYEADMSRQDAARLFGERRHTLELDAESRDYAESLVRDVTGRMESLDRTIATLAPAWPVSQMARLDVAILRIAISEIDGGEVPPPVAISEAVELAKRYCTEGARRMINGALGTYARRDAEHL